MRDIKNLLSQTKPYLPSPPPMHHHHLLHLLLLHSLPFPPPPPPPRTTPNQIAAIRSQSSHSSSYTHYQINDKFHRKKKKKTHNQNLNPKKESCKSAITMARRECETKKVGRIFQRFPLTVAVLFCSKIPFSLSLSLCLSLNLCLGEREKCREKMREREGKIVVKVSEWVEWSVKEREREWVFDESDWWIKSKRQLKPK